MTFTQRALIIKGLRNKFIDSQCLKEAACHWNMKKIVNLHHSSFHRWIFRNVNYSYPAGGEPGFAECSGQRRRQGLLPFALRERGPGKSGRSPAVIMIERVNSSEAGA